MDRQLEVGQPAFFVMKREIIFNFLMNNQPPTCVCVCVCPGFTPADPGEGSAKGGVGEDERGEASSQRTNPESEGGEE